MGEHVEGFFKYIFIQVNGRLKEEDNCRKKHESGCSVTEQNTFVWQRVAECGYGSICSVSLKGQAV